MEEENNDISGSTDHLAPPAVTVAVALNGKKRSKYVVSWALDKFAREGSVGFKLLHVRPKIAAVPTPLGVAIPLCEVREDVAATYRQEIEFQANEMLLPYKRMCIRRKVKAEIVLHESDDVPASIAEELSRHSITSLVVGLSKSGFIARKPNISSLIAEGAPSYCTVYVVSKGKLFSVRSSDSGPSAPIIKDESERFSSTSSPSGQNTVSSHAAAESHFPAGALPVQRTVQYPLIDGGPTDAEIDGQGNAEDARTVRLSSRWRNSQGRMSSLSSSSNNQEITEPESPSGNPSDLMMDNPSAISHQTSAVPSRFFATESQLSEPFAGPGIVFSTVVLPKNLDYEIERLKAEKERCEEAIRKAERARDVKEASRRREARLKEKGLVASTQAGPPLQYQHFSWEEIVAATSFFSEDLRIGIGAHGTVYKWNLHNTTAAVKVLHPGENKLPKVFQQELEILSKIRHPHLLPLLGACPEEGCVVYEYMEKGSLKDRLLLVNGTPPIQWCDRFRIAWEVASALVFLHKMNPKPIILHDLKPSNILLDHNFVSKVDVGLSTMAPYVPSKSTIYKTGVAGTQGYVDPDNRRSSTLSPKSDVHCLGVVILRLITAKPAMGLVDEVREAIDDDEKFHRILDHGAGDWPIDETREFAALGLWCSERRQEDRPDLKDQVLPTLGQLRKAAEKAQKSRALDANMPPFHFICPLLEDVMGEPCVAADGFSYDRGAIEKWLKDNDTSPVTKLPFPNRNLWPNYTLYAAITEWKSRKH